MAEHAVEIEELAVQLDDALLVLVVDFLQRKTGDFRLRCARASMASPVEQSLRAAAYAARSWSRSTFFCTLPVDVLGSGPKMTRFGALNRASRLRTCSISSASVAGGAFLQRDERDRNLAPFLVGRRDHGHFEHRGVARQRILDLDRRDVLAAGDDDVLRAVAQRDVAVGEHDAEVAGAEPAVGTRSCAWSPRPCSSRASRCCRGWRSRPSSRASARHVGAGRRRRRARAGSTTLPTPCRDLSRACSGIGSAFHSLRQSQSTIGPYVSVRPYRCVMSMPSSARRSSSAGVGGAPPVPMRTGRGSFSLPAPGSQIVIVSTVGAAQKWLTPECRMCRQIARGLELRQAQMHAAHRRDRPREAPAVAVEHRQRPQVDGVAVEPHVQRHRQRLQVRAAMVVHDALGPRGRAARVVEREQRTLVRHRAGNAARRRRSAPPARRRRRRRARAATPARPRAAACVAAVGVLLVVDAAPARRHGRRM